MSKCFAVSRRSKPYDTSQLKVTCFWCTAIGLALGAMAFASNPIAHGQAVVQGISSVDSIGLEARVRWTSSRVQGFPDPPPPLELQRVYPELELPNLLALNRIPNSNFLLAVDHQTEWGGPSRVVQFVQDGTGGTTKEFLSRPEIIYGLAFSPQFAEDRYVYVGCNGRSEALEATATRVLRFKVAGDGPFHCDPDSMEVVIEWKSNGHNGGDLAFGNDGMLYVSAGDGTSDSDQNRTGQDLTRLQGSMLRIDVRNQTGQQNYRIPPDNPFVNYVDPVTNVPARGEIWAYGLRNPWRISFDRDSAQLWVGNNGQDLWESVYLIEKGANYGWSVRESNHDFHTGQSTGPSPIASATVEHHHREARSLTGGHVYRGDQFPEFQGCYFYGDFSTGNIWAVRHDGEKGNQVLLVARSTSQITGFGVDHDGELLVADHVGKVYRFVRRAEKWVDSFPKKLSETGLFEDVAKEIPASGVISYSVNAPLWSDGASKKRWLAVPGDETVTVHPRQPWEFPEGTVLVKSFGYPQRGKEQIRTFETRLLALQRGQWHGYSYRWNEEQTDALLVSDEGLDERLDWVDWGKIDLDRTHVAGGKLGGEDAGSQGLKRNAMASQAESDELRWHYPSRTECMVCHSRAAGFVLGLSIAQLSRSHTYASAEGPKSASQISTLHHIGLFGDVPRPEPKPSQILGDPSDASLSLDVRARSYLHANCSSCHMEAGGGNARIDLTYTADLRQRTKLLDTDPLHGTLGLPEARLLAPGDPGRSLLFARMARRGAGQMPPLGTFHVDAKSVDLIRTWIESLGTTED